MIKVSINLLEINEIIRSIVNYIKNLCIKVVVTNLAIKICKFSRLIITTNMLNKDAWITDKITGNENDFHVLLCVGPEKGRCTYV
jgi:hypothetical protein